MTMIGMTENCFTGICQGGSLSFQNNQEKAREGSTFATDLQPYIQIKGIANLISQYRGIWWREDGDGPEEWNSWYKKRNYIDITKKMMDYFELSSSEMSIGNIFGTPYLSGDTPMVRFKNFLLVFPEITKLNINQYCIDVHIMRTIIINLPHLNSLDIRNAIVSECAISELLNSKIVIISN